MKKTPCITGDQPPPLPAVYTIKEVAAAGKMSEGTLRRHIKKGLIHVIRKNRRHIRIKQLEAHKYLYGEGGAHETVGVVHLREREL
jgi:hypothetical protein